LQLERKKGVFFTFQSLTTAYRLSERYVHDTAQPGSSFRLLTAAADYTKDRLIESKTVETALSETLGIKIGVADDAEEKDTLLNLESLLHQQVIGQDAAVVAVANALRRARAGVRNQTRPVGAFLFLGPTGVGKTELAKAIAAAYYGGADKLVRVDMNQFVTAETVADLTADPADNPTSLTAQVMKSPFAVVLLDEIEKAHPTVLAALLQMLDEGIMRDSKSREIDFRDCIIIATSNAGADVIREHIASGARLEDFRDEFVNQLIDSKQFLPEFLNRFDEIIVFAPLSKQDLEQVVQLLVAGVNQTLEPQKIRVELTPEALVKLVSIGYDPRLGARPLRRIVQKTIENQVATAVISGATNSGDTISITAEQIAT
jgi:ATP-dependent Clp protease ATP-binding subunit ClpC